MLEFKLDLRLSPHPRSSVSKDSFLSIREYLWENYGASKEIRFWLEDHRKSATERQCHSPDWCWDTEHHQCRIYLSEVALSYCSLRWA